MTEKRENIVIIGAGQAGLQACISLRQKGHDGSITLIGEEPHAPYQRPPLSKKFLAGEISPERLELKPAAFFAEADISLKLGRKATAVNTTSRVVSLDDGAAIPYDALLFATGTRPRDIPLPGRDLEGVMTLRTIADVERFRPYIAAGNRAAIIGGGYIGLEVAAVARALGLEVHVFEAADRVMQRVVSPEVSGFFTALHRRNGVTVDTGASIAGIAGDDHCTGVATTDGRIIPADLVLVAVGSAPITDLAEWAGIVCDNGISVDGGCQTSDPNVFAAGDCTSFHANRFDRRIRLESVQNAIDQAKAAAGSMLGDGVDYDPVPWFWSDQYDIKLQIAGLSQGYDTAEVRGDPETGAFAVVYSREGTLLAVDTINQPRGHMLARRAIGEAVDRFDWHPA